MFGSTIRGSAQVRITVKGRSEKPAARTRLSSVLDPVGDGVVAGDLRRAVAVKELGRIGRTVALVEQVEVGIGGNRVAFVDDGGVHPRGQHVRAPGMGGGGDVTVGGGNSVNPAAGRMPSSGVTFGSTACDW